MLWAHLRPTPI